MAKADRQRPAYVWMLVGILVLYAAIIGFGETDVAGPLRVTVLAIVVWNASRLRSGTRERRIALAMGAVTVSLSVAVSFFGSPRTVDAVVATCSLLLTGTAITNIASTLRRRLAVDVSTVLGVLCIYLMFALFFADLHQFFATFTPGYLSGTPDPPTPSVMLYFSVITLATVGFGDITPATEAARAITVVEALTGQLYLVSVVAAVVGGWRRA
jgi:amino acid transporter